MVPGWLAPVREGESRHPIAADARALLRALWSRCRQQQPAELATLLNACVGSCYSQNAAAVAEALKLPAAASWMFAAPVWLRPEHAGIYLLGSRPLQFTESEAHAYCQHLNNWLQQDQMCLYPVTPSTWLLALPSADDTHWIPLAEAIGRDLRELQPQGANRLRWQSRLTEWQMVLNQLPLNQQRQQRGQATVHSLWLWGDRNASATSAPFAPMIALPADSLLARCHLSGNTPCDLSGLLAQDVSAATIIDERLHDAFVHGDVAGYQAALQTLFSDTLLPLQQALDHGELTELWLYPDDGSAYVLTRRSRWAFWRRALLPALLREA